MKFRRSKNSGDPVGGDANFLSNMDFQWEQRRREQRKMTTILSWVCVLLVAELAPRRQATMNLDRFRARMDPYLAAKKEDEVLGFRAYHLYKGCLEELCDMDKTKRLKKMLLRGLAMTRKVMVEEVSRGKKNKQSMNKRATASSHNRNDNDKR